MGKRKPVVEKVKRIRNLSIAAGACCSFYCSLYFQWPQSVQAV